MADDDSKLGRSPNTSIAEIPNTGAALSLSDLSPLLAAELAAGLSSPTTIRTRYGLTKEQWDLLRTNQSFRGILKEALRDWRGDLNAGRRITLKAETLLEELLPELYQMVKSEAVPSSEKINAIKQLADLAGRSAKTMAPTGGGAGGGFTLNINLGKGPDNTVTINAVPEPASG